LRYKNEQLV